MAKIGDRFLGFASEKSREFMAFMCGELLDIGVNLSPIGLGFTLSTDSPAVGESKSKLSSNVALGAIGSKRDSRATAPAPVLDLLLAYLAFSPFKSHSLLLRFDRLLRLALDGSVGGHDRRLCHCELVLWARARYWRHSARHEPGSAQDRKSVV